MGVLVEHVERYVDSNRMFQVGQLSGLPVRAEEFPAFPVFPVHVPTPVLLETEFLVLAQEFVLRHVHILEAPVLANFRLTF